MWHDGALVMLMMSVRRSKHTPVRLQSHGGRVRELLGDRNIPREGLQLQADVGRLTTVAGRIEIEVGVNVAGERFGVHISEKAGLDAHVDVAGGRSDSGLAGLPDGHIDVATRRGDRGLRGCHGVDVARGGGELHAVAGRASVDVARGGDHAQGALRAVGHIHITGGGVDVEGVSVALNVDVAVGGANLNALVGALDVTVRRGRRNVK